MDNEEEFLRRISDQAAGAALLSASIRWGLEGVIDNREELPVLAVRLQELVESALALIEARRRKVRQEGAGGAEAVQPTR